jgi:tetrahydromethanopterin S-methyltransferase subunit G
VSQQKDLRMHSLQFDLEEIQKTAQEVKSKIEGGNMEAMNQISKIHGRKEGILEEIHDFLSSNP